MSRSSLRPDDILHAIPGVELTPLPDQRLLVRHPGGVSVLAGATRDALQAILARVDGQTTAEALCAELANEIAPRKTRTILRRLMDEVFYRERRSPAVTAATATTEPVLVIGDGTVAERLAAALARGWPVEREAFATAEPEQETRWRRAGLLLFVLEDRPWSTLHAAQGIALRADVPSLFAVVDPDGVRLGPLIIPGETACLFCAQTAQLSFLQLDADELFTVAGTLRSGRCPEALAGAVVAALAHEAREALADDGEPALLSEVLHISSSGRKRVAVERRLDCPLCGAIPATVRDDRPRLSRLTAQARLARALAQRSRPRLTTRESDDDVATVGILGGGTAGYLTALALRRHLPHLDVTLIESSGVPVIGVGEATTPLMPQFLHEELALPVAELFDEVEPTFKLGIRFEWGRGHFNYPFGPVHVLEPAVYDGNILRCSPQSLWMSADRLPPHRGPSRELVRSDLKTQIAYHLDNERFVRYLQNRARDAGIRRLDAKIVDVELDDDGETVRALVAEDGRRLVFDLFVDCSGFRSLLIEKALRSPWRSFAESLPADRAVIAKVPHGGHVKPYTVAEAMSAGWCWNTPQRREDHRGYVFCSDFLSDDDAIAEMRQRNPGLGEPRVIEFRSGRHEHFWKGNVVALGNAYGFVEPLESTALHLLIRQIKLLVGAFPLRRGDCGVEGVLNRRVGDFWDYLRWFLALHYKFNHAMDTPFWRHCRDVVDVSLHEELLVAFKERGPLSYDPLIGRSFDYPDPLWGAEGIDVILLGQGVPSRLGRPLVERAVWERRLSL